MQRELTAKGSGRSPGLNLKGSDGLAGVTGSSPKPITVVRMAECSDGAGMPGPMPTCQAREWGWLLQTSWVEREKGEFSWRKIRMLPA